MAFPNAQDNDVSIPHPSLPLIHFADAPAKLAIGAAAGASDLCLFPETCVQL